jgi:hypothetical protein
MDRFLTSDTACVISYETSTEFGKLPHKAPLVSLSWLWIQKGYWVRWRAVGSWREELRMRPMCEKEAVSGPFPERNIVVGLTTLNVNSVLVTVGRLVGGMRRTTASYRPTPQTQTYTYASRDTVLASQSKVIERLSTVGTWKGRWKYCREQSAWRYTRKNLRAPFFSAATLSGILAPKR